MTDAELDALLANAKPMAITDLLVAFECASPLPRHVVPKEIFDALVWCEYVDGNRIVYRAEEAKAALRAAVEQYKRERDAKEPA